MNIGNLKMFCRVVDEGSISKAARMSYVSQPSVTSQIRQLEKYYGVDLFDRSGGKLTTTEAGMTLYPYAKEIIDYLKKSEEAVQHIFNDYESTLYIGASLTIGEYLLPGILGEFQKEYKNINFSLTIGNTPSIVGNLENHDIDIALVEGIVTNESLQTKKFAEDELILVIPSNHRWKNMNEISINELSEEKMIWREENSGARNIIEKIFTERNVMNKIRSRMEFGSTQSIKSAIEVGLGIGIIPKWSVIRELEMGVLKHMPISDITISRDLWVVQRPSRFPKKTMEQFTAFLTKQNDKLSLRAYKNENLT
ncbi:LysR family transcriptional regulator [Sporosarcina globispora]|uniref:LysR family transcriptional regulator n=2 Tax=Sporosarcina globispora TaxID=1459 RepID=A0A0M0GK38_SPOGL|nr:LysR family transcriptional regulator [Sporosarcina globispora]